MAWIIPMAVVGSAEGQCEVVAVSVFMGVLASVTAQLVIDQTGAWACCEELLAWLLLMEKSEEVDPKMLSFIPQR